MPPTRNRTSATIPTPNPQRVPHTIGSVPRRPRENTSELVGLKVLVWISDRSTLDFRGVPSLSSQEHIDWQLMQRVAASDEAAIGELYARFGVLVFQTARQVLGARSETDDAVQEVFVRLWRTADRFDPNRAKLVTWVMLITRRHLIDRLRRQAVRPDRVAFDETRMDADTVRRGGGPVGVPSEGESDETRQRLIRQLDRLPELQRTVIERAYLQGFSLREIAGQLDAPLGTVKSALSRGLARLRDLEGIDGGSGAERNGGRA